MDSAFLCTEHNRQVYTFHSTFSDSRGITQIHKQPTSSFCFTAGEASFPNRRMVVWRSITLWMVGIRSSRTSLKRSSVSGLQVQCKRRKPLPDFLSMSNRLLFFKNQNNEIGRRGLFLSQHLLHAEISNHTLKTPLGNDYESYFKPCLSASAFLLLSISARQAASTESAFSFSNSFRRSCEKNKQKHVGTNLKKTESDNRNWFVC